MYVSQQRVRAHNLGSVAAFVRERGSCSRSDIGEALNLNKATVSSLVGELIARGLLENAGQHAGTGPGRPRTMVRPDSASHVSVVVEILPDRVRLSSWTLSAARTGHRTLDLEPATGDPAESLRRIGDAVVRWVRRLRDEDRRVTGIAVSVPGLVNTRTGTVVQSSPLQWQDVDVRAALQRRPPLADLPVFVERVANLAAVAEWQRSPEQQDFICLHGGETGLGVGVVTGGRLLSGANGRAGGLLFADNIRTDLSGTRRLLTGSGAMARLVSPPAERLGFVELIDRVRGRHTSFTDETAALLERLEQGDAELDAAVLQFAERLGHRLVALLELFDPAEVIFSGPLDPLAERIIPPVRRVLRETTMPEVVLRSGGSGPEASLIGGALMLADHTFAQIDSSAA